MKVFLVRHGDADAEIPEGLGDEGRALTAKARQQMVAHFAALAEHMAGVDLILTSPLVRAVQTAQILSLALEHDGLLKAHRCLQPEMPVGAMETAIQEHAGDNLVMVGHQPSMGAMTALLLGMQSFPKPFSPGTVVALEFPESARPQPPAKLLWYSVPGQPLLTSVD